MSFYGLRVFGLGFRGLEFRGGIPSSGLGVQILFVEGLCPSAMVFGTPSTDETC